MKYSKQLLTVLFLCLLFPPLVRATPLRVAYPEFQPFFFRNAQSEMHGIFYEIVTEALRRQHVETVWEAFPWSRCQAEVREGRQDAMITVPTEERAAYTVTHAKPFYRKTMNLFTYANNPRIKKILAIQSLADIKNAGFSVITYSTNGWSKDNVETAGIRVLETPTLPSIWRMLAHRRGDLVIEWPPGAMLEIRKAGLENQIVETNIELASMPFHLLVRKGSPYASVVDSFDATIEQMREDGTLQRILSRYQ